MVERETLIAMVRGLQNGDPDAATRLYETFQSDIYYFILKTVNNDRDLAEDLTQDTFIEILETVDKLQEPAAFVTWSKQIAYHKCTAYFRKRKELLVDENEDGYSVFDTVEEDREEFIPDAALDHDDLKRTILKMIGQLPEEQRSAIVLRYFNEISVKEIAEIQGVTEGTVKSRLNYGRKAIKQAVETFEKKNGIRLHCVGVLPLLLWFFKNYRIQTDLHITSQTAAQAFVIGEESAGAAAAVGSSAAASAAAASASTAAAAAGGTGVAASALATKIVAAVAAAAVAIGGVSIGIASARPQKDEPEQAVVATYEETDPVEETYEVAELPTQLPTEAPTEATEPTEVTQPEESPSVSPTQAAPQTEVTEPPTAPAETEAPTEAAAEPAGCEHSLVMVSQLYGYDYINETWECTKCGVQEYVNYPNPCSHEGELRSDYIMVCIHCGLAMGYYPPEETPADAPVVEDGATA